MDIEHLTDADLARLIDQARQLLAAREQTRQQEAADLGVSIHAAIGRLDTLIGPSDAAKDITTINGCLAFTDAEMAANAGIALRQVFLGLRELAVTTRAIAIVESRRP